MSRQIFLLSIAGMRSIPGQMAAITETLGQHDVEILDMGQSEIHDTLNLAIMIQCPADLDLIVLKEVVFRAHEQGLKVEFTPITTPDYERWVRLEKVPRFIVTVVSRTCKARPFGKVTRLLAEYGLNIDGITRLSRINSKQGSTWGVASKRFALQLEVSGKGNSHGPDIGKLREDLFKITLDSEIDVGFQDDDLFRRNRRMVLFDMDSTLIQCEVIDELAKHAGVGKEVADITEAAMRGEIDFQESFRQRMRLLKGMDEGVLKQIADNLPVTEGAPRLIATLKRLGYKIGILSGGFTYFAHRLQQAFGIDYVFANELDFKDGKLTGEVKGDIVDGNRKAELLKQLAHKEGILLKQVIAVGDGANDIPMLKLAGLGVAFHAKPRVKEQAQVGISTVGLDGILYLLGICETLWSSPEGIEHAFPQAPVGPSRL
uniref:phosphoserine phosphatase n=1 Tax=Hemiselmis andersenii TaxID=464988 RepID=A0A6U4VMX4_HEMAN|mmetsp:Transcript_33310/g.77997  ORF Transcript_33310/g.77997 Transcript_33310/m.77997 type:complete len:431 (-) Transcript_33310:39-1331(-)